MAEQPKPSTESALFKSPEQAREKQPPVFVDRERGIVNVLGIELEMNREGEGSVFREDDFKDFVWDQSSLDLARRIATCVKLKQPLLVEGPTDIGKSRVIEYLSYLCDVRIFRESLSGQTDVTEFIGKYVPNTKSGKELFESRITNPAALKEESRAVIQAAETQLSEIEGRLAGTDMSAQERGVLLSQEHGIILERNRQIIAIEGWRDLENVGWVWEDGSLIKAMTWNGGRGAWFYLDEVSAVEPQILKRLNRVFEGAVHARVEVFENGGRMVEGGRHFWTYASTNPPNPTAGTVELGPDFIRRFVYQKAPALDTDTMRLRSIRLFNSGVTIEYIDDPKAFKKLIADKVRAYRHVLVERQQLSETPFDLRAAEMLPLFELVDEAVIAFHAAAAKMVEQNEFSDQTQRFEFTMTDIIRLINYVIALQSEDLTETLKRGIEFYYVGKVEAPEKQEKLRNALEQTLKALKTAERIKELLETPDIKKRRALEQEADRVMESVKKQFEALTKRKADMERATARRRAAVEHAKGEYEGVREMAESAARVLGERLTTRSKELGSDLEFHLNTPEIPEDITPEHIEALTEFFGGNAELRVIPAADELDNFSSAYAAVMYPDEDKKRQANDAANHDGLLSYRPDWFSKRAEGFVDRRPEAARGTWGEAYLYSMRKELETLGNSVILVETTQKPNYTNGEQHYGTEEGTNTSTDPLLPLFQEVFGENANRFNHTWGELETQLLPKIKEKIIQSLQKKHLPIPNFDVILLPASISNIEMTLYHPENSTTNTYEWTSTPLIDDINNDTGYRLAVGDSDGGGAGDVDDDRRDHRNVGLGTRLAVVFKPTDH